MYIEVDVLNKNVDWVSFSGQKLEVLYGMTPYYKNDGNLECAPLGRIIQDDNADVVRNDISEKIEQGVPHNHLNHQWFEVYWLRIHFDTKEDIVAWKLKYE